MSCLGQRMTSFQAEQENTTRISTNSLTIFTTYSLDHDVHPLPPVAAETTHKNKFFTSMTFQNRHSIWHSIWHSYLAFYLALYLTFYLAFLSGILICHSSLAFYLAFHLALLSGILIWHSSLAFYLALYLTFYLAFYLAYLLAFSPAVKVRQGTLGVDSRG